MGETSTHHLKGLSDKTEMLSVALRSSLSLQVKWWSCWVMVDRVDGVCWSEERSHDWCSPMLHPLAASCAELVGESEKYNLDDFIWPRIPSHSLPPWIKLICPARQSSGCQGEDDTVIVIWDSYIVWHIGPSIGKSSDSDNLKLAS